MDIAKANKALETLAKQKGVSVIMIRQEIEKAIEEALKDPDWEARAFWFSIPHKSKIPTPEEVIAYIVKNQ